MEQLTVEQYLQSIWQAPRRIETSPSLLAITSDLGNPLPVSSGVSVSGTVSASGPLTDTQLRAAAVPAQDSGLPVALDADGGLKAHVQYFPATHPVGGTFWQTTQSVSLGHRLL